MKPDDLAQRIAEELFLIQQTVEKTEGFRKQHRVIDLAEKLSDCHHFFRDEIEDFLDQLQLKSADSDADSNWINNYSQ
ncbi:MAG: hypothetical protein ACFCU8_18045 [Thermosynechococcaceae cyanobacterium]